MNTSIKCMLLVCGLSVGGWAQADVPSIVSGLKTPESVLVGPDGRIYVSEIGEFGKDGDGQISVIGQDGQAQVFASGMDDPKGLAVVGNSLYVADKSRVLKVGMDGKWEVFAAATAFPVVPQFLNDLVSDAKGNVYVSDTGDLKGHGGAVYRIARDGKVTLIANGEKDVRVLGPNGLLMDGASHLLEVDFVSGILYRIEIKSGAMEQVATGFGGGDGVVRSRTGVIYVSDWQNGRVYSLSRKGEVKLIKDGYKSAADIGLTRDGKYILVPDMKAGELHWLKIRD